jgi:peptidoglycan/xylan/chitin deacetylase (PgdA/CDA1 family)
MAEGWKHIAETVAFDLGLHRCMARRNQPTTAILAYHNIVPTGEELAGEASLHIDQRVFAEHLDFLGEHYHVASLSEAWNRHHSDRSRVIITFDDAYRGTMTAGLEELRRRDLPATVFVPAGLLGAAGFWWDILAPERGGNLPAELRNYCLVELQGRGDRILKWANEEGLAAAHLPQHARPCDEAMVLQQAMRGRITLGAHTWSHPNLATLSPDELGREMEQSNHWLTTKSSSPVRWLAYPYGLTSPAAIAMAQDHFRGALLIRGGIAERRGRRASPPHTTPRLNVPRNLSTRGLALRIAGLLG